MLPEYGRYCWSPAGPLRVFSRLVTKCFLSVRTIVLDFALINTQLEPHILKCSIQRISY